MGIGQGNAGEHERWRVANVRPQPGAKNRANTERTRKGAGDETTA